MNFPVFLLLVAALASPALAAEPTPARQWVTTVDLKQRLTEGPALPWNLPAPPDARVIQIRPDIRFQSLLGLGSSLEPTTCSNLVRLPPAERRRAIELLVHPSRGIGMNLMRICIGTPDFTGDPWYSYCDRPAGETDPELRHFSIDRDRAYILPVLREALSVNPDLLFIASPWSPPAWMKSTGQLTGGELLPRWYSAYARYFVRFIQAYQAEGIPIHAVTVQNEPGVDRSLAKDPKWHYPSCRWTGAQERDFIRDHLGPALRDARLGTRIWCYDHNYNLEPKDDDPGLAHPRTILSDPGAAAFVGGVAFHGYAGNASGMSRFKEEFPRVPIHFTEGSVFAIWGAHHLIQRLRNHAESYNAWVSILDDRGRPNNGPFPATHAILKLHSDTLRIEELFEYYNYGHFMRFLPRGSTRVESTPGDDRFDNVVFRRPDGTLVAILVNTTEQPVAFALRLPSGSLSDRIAGKSVMTLQWNESAVPPAPGATPTGK